MLDIDLLAQIICLDKETGYLFWLARDRKFFRTDGEHKRWNGRYAGKRAFTINSNGYRDGMIFRKMHRAHHVAWALHYGAWPTMDIDHINGDRDDNRISNLRQVTRSENCRNTFLRRNNTSGVMGVSKNKNRWIAYIYDQGRHRTLGRFKTLEEAAAARKSADRDFGYHPTHGRARPVYGNP